MKTSDAFLRAFSKTKSDDLPELLAADAPFDTLISLASPVDQAVLTSLSQTLALTGSEQMKAARELATRLDKEKGDVNRDKKKLQGEYNRDSQWRGRNAQAALARAG